MKQLSLKQLWLQPVANAAANNYSLQYYLYIQVVEDTVGDVYSRGRYVLKYQMFHPYREHNCKESTSFGMYGESIRLYDSGTLTGTLGIYGVLVGCSI